MLECRGDNKRGREDEGKEGITKEGGNERRIKCKEYRKNETKEVRNFIKNCKKLKKVLKKRKVGRKIRKELLSDLTKRKKKGKNKTNIYTMKKENKRTIGMKKRGGGKRERTIRKI